jgi:hypothetical protein
MEISPNRPKLVGGNPITAEIAIVSCGSNFPEPIELKKI